MFTEPYTLPLAEVKSTVGDRDRQRWTKQQRLDVRRLQFRRMVEEVITMKETTMKDDKTKKKISLYLLLNWTSG